MRKFIKSFLLLFIIVPCILLGFTGCDDDMGKDVVKINTIEDLKSSIENTTENSVLRLENDLILNEQLVINKKVSLDMNGKKISNTEEIWDKANKQYSLISVQKNGDLTIKGSGKIEALQDDAYGIDVREGSSCTIYDCEVIGNVHSLYAIKGTINVNGGRYSIKQTSQIENKPYEFVLNCLDENYQNQSAVINVFGGEFVNFNPCNNKAEGENSNFVRDGYKVESLENNIFRVVQE